MPVQNNQTNRDDTDRDSDKAGHSQDGKVGDDMDLGDFDDVQER